ncbi:MAG: hypothetical protein Q9192_004968 [Flavoplaca navasiana]
MTKFTSLETLGHLQKPTTSMLKDPIFVITHSRSCSTAFERVLISPSLRARAHTHTHTNTHIYTKHLIPLTSNQIFMTRRDILTFFHEPFGDAFYFGPEKISPAHLRWPADKIERSGRGHCTYDYILQSILSAQVRSYTSRLIAAQMSHTLTLQNQDSTKRVFIKDMSYHIVPPIHSTNAHPPSLQAQNLSNKCPNPTLLPTEFVNSCKVVFLIRNPSAAISSLYRCFIPPLSAQTGDTLLDPTELGYRELRILFDYLRDKNGVVPLVIDADDLLADPEAILRPLCDDLEIPYSSSMLEWPAPEDHAFALSLFEKFAGYHEDALNSKGFVPKGNGKKHAEPQSKEEQNDIWESKYGSEGMQIIRSAVDACLDDYEYLESLRMHLT